LNVEGGIETLAEMKRREYKRLPTVMLTAHALDSFREAVSKYGIHQFVTKPFSTEEVRFIFAPKTKTVNTADN
jgi:CheY-like chemotaxis protein